MYILSFITVKVQSFLVIEEWGSVKKRISNYLTNFHTKMLYLSLKIGFNKNKMQWVDRIRQVKLFLVVTAVVIAGASLIVSHYLVSDLAREEVNKMKVWAEAMHTINNTDSDPALSLALKVINGNNTIPVLVLDASGIVSDYRNVEIDEKSAEDSLYYLNRLAARLKAEQRVIVISGFDEISGIDVLYEVCYDDSTLLKRLTSYPYVQLGVVLIFVVVAIFALLSSKRAEQNKVWVGLSKETAHQLGTPISSLMAWVEILRENYPDDTLIPEMDNDLKRLQLIADRFSKIGSLPEPKHENINEVLERVVGYISRRTSNKVQMRCIFPSHPVMVKLNASLFEWVIENLCKNAIDAMDGQGSITLYLADEDNRVVIEVRDTGKGISKKHFGTVFTPGFTTKSRGWGLGLSLAKRIVEEYHQGRIYVKSSAVGRGTTFCIELKK